MVPCESGLIKGFQLLTYSKTFLFKKLAYLCVYAVTLFLGMVMYANEVETKEK